MFNSSLLQEYHNWKHSLNRKCDNDDIKKLKNYLDKLPYTLKSTVWIHNTSNDGYYGISLKSKTYKQVFTSQSGKKVSKRVSKDNALIKSWRTIVEAATSEGISTSKMSRLAKSETVIHDYYYTIET